MPTAEWLNKYESIKDKLTCKIDLDAYFTEKVIGNMAVDVLDIGAVHFPTGQIFACDPLVELEDTLPFSSRHGSFLLLIRFKHRSALCNAYLFSSNFNFQLYAIVRRPSRTLAEQGQNVLIRLPTKERFRKATQRQPLYQCMFHEDDGSLTESYGLMFE